VAGASSEGCGWTVPVNAGGRCVVVHFVVCVCLHASVTRPAAPPHVKIPFECDNGRLRLNITLVADPSSNDVEPIDIDLASIGKTPTPTPASKATNLKNSNNTNPNRMPKFKPFPRTAGEYHHILQLPSTSGSVSPLASPPPPPLLQFHSHNKSPPPPQSECSSRRSKIAATCACTMRLPPTITNQPKACR